MITAQSISLLDQVAILQRCISEQLDLRQELSLLGLTYDDLRYRHNPSSNPHSLPYLPLDHFSAPAHRTPIVSFFAGAGGLDLGFTAAGFQHLAAIEINPLCCQTLRTNHPEWQVIGPPLHSGDIRDRENISALLHALPGIIVPFEGMFIGGPPCQPFSVAANQRFAKQGDQFKRVGFASADYGNLLFDYIWYIETFQPRGFLLENVTGLLDIDSGKQLFIGLSRLVAKGYTITQPTIINAADYGVPQNRHRLFIVGWRTAHTFAFPPPRSLPISCGQALRTSVHGLANHITRAHQAASVLRYMELACGARDRLGRVDRLNPHSPAKTVISGGSTGGGRSHLHPFIPRTLSVRESARLQTFPDTFVFCGASARQFTQVGNAVPPLLAFHLACAVYTQLFA
ncbi:MAG TPA: DNA cytosine methyltransferase [Microcoleaceae cyanobacterium]